MTLRSKLYGAFYINAIYRLISIPLTGRSNLGWPLQKRPTAHNIITLLITSGMLTLGFVAHAAAQHCTTRYSDEVYNTSPTGATFIAVSAFTLNCHGDITGSLRVTAGSTSKTQLQIEKEDNGTWMVVEYGNHIAHQADPGTYRLTVEQSGRRGNFTSWRLRYSKPLP